MATRVRSGTRFSPANFSEGTIFVSGLPEINRAFSRIDRGLKGSLNKTLKKVGEPVRHDAQQLAPHVIRNLRAGPGPGGSDWSGVRTGLTQSTVYIAPTERGRSRNQKRKRPNFKDLMLERAYVPALDHNRERVLREFDGLLDGIVTAWGM